MSKNLYLAKKDILPQLEGIIDVVCNLNDTVKKLCEKYELEYTHLINWVKGEIDSATTSDDYDDYDEDEDDEE